MHVQQRGRSTAADHVAALAAGGAGARDRRRLRLRRGLSDGSVSVIRPSQVTISLIISQSLTVSSRPVTQTDSDSDSSSLAGMDSVAAARPAAGGPVAPVARHSIRTQVNHAKRAYHCIISLSLVYVYIKYQVRKFAACTCT